MAKQITDLTDQLYQYMIDISLREHSALKHLRDETNKLPHAIMQISPDQGQFMALLVELIGARKVIEIGTYTGYSALVMALALPSNGKVITCDIDKTNTAMARQYWEQAGVAHKVEFKLGPALETLDQLIEQGDANTFDFAFIDADKENNQNYYERCLQLMRPGGLIAVDNTFRFGRVVDSSINSDGVDASRAFNTFVKNDERVSISVIPIGDGLTLARKR